MKKGGRVGSALLYSCGLIGRPSQGRCRLVPCISSSGNVGPTSCPYSFVIPFFILLLPASWILAAGATTFSRPLFSPSFSTCSLCSFISLSFQTANANREWKFTDCEGPYLGAYIPGQKDTRTRSLARIRSPQTGRQHSLLFIFFPPNNNNKVDWTRKNKSTKLLTTISVCVRWSR